MASPSTYFGANVHRIELAASLGQIIVARCNFCRQTANYLASDLETLFDPRRDVFSLPFRCPNCRRSDYIRIDCHIPRGDERGKIVVRRPAGVKRVQMWREEVWE